MSTFESNVKQIPHPQTMVYAALSDLTVIDKVRDRIPADKAKDLDYDADHLTISVQPVGKISLRIVERQAPNCIKFQSEQSPIGFAASILLEPVTAESCKLIVSLKADLNPFIKGMVSGPLKEGIEKVAEALSMIPYNKLANAAE